MLFPGDGPDLVGDLRKILVLAEDEGHIAFAPVGECDHIERDPHVDPLLFAGQKGVLRAIGQIHAAVSVSKRPAVHDHATPPHGRELVGPEGVPPGVVADIGDSGVEADLRQFPSLPRANLIAERGNVIVGVGVAERLADGMEQVLAVHEGDRTLDGRLAVH